MQIMSLSRWAIKRVDGERCLAGGMIADDQFTLTPSKREQRIHCHDPGLHRLGHEIALYDRRRRAFDRQPHRVFSIRPLPSSGRPSGSTIRPSKASPTGTFTTSPVPNTASPASTLVAASSRTQLIRSESSTRAKPTCPCLKVQNLVKPHIAQPGNYGNTVADLLDPPPVFNPRTECGVAQRTLRSVKPVRCLSWRHP
jgi:hypothetical protein